MINFTYKNTHTRMLIIRCIGEGGFFVEKVVYPKEVIAFEAPQGAKVEIWGSDLTSSHIEDRMTVGETH